MSIISHYKDCNVASKTLNNIQEEQWKRTSWKIIKSNYNWIIDNSHDLMKSGFVWLKSIESPLFSTRWENDQFSFKIKMKPISEKNKENVGFEIVSCNNFSFEKKGIFLCFSFHLKNENYEIISENLSQPFAPRSYGDSKESNGFMRNVILDSNNYPTNKLIVTCVLEFMIQINRDILNPTTHKVNETALPKEKLSDKCKNYDFKIICGKNQFKCHKEYLSAKSEVFSAMFMHKNTKEFINNELVIDENEISLIGIEKFLEFIYTNTIEDFHQEASDLYVMADKYGISELKEIAAQAMIDKLDVNNALDILILGYRHSHEELISNVTRYLLDNLVDIIQLKIWKDFKKLHPEIVDNLLLKKYS